jgi:hypothetical protein
MRQDESADTGLPGDLAALSGVQVDGTRPVSRKGTVQNGKIGISAEVHEAVAVL